MVQHIGQKAVINLSQYALGCITGGRAFAVGEWWGGLDITCAYCHSALARQAKL